jgi:hypothetical protein
MVWFANRFDNLYRCYSDISYQWSAVVSRCDSIILYVMQVFGQCIFYGA